MPEDKRFTIELTHQSGYAFQVKFDWEGVPSVVMDEPPPLGHQDGPNAARMLAAAVGNCLSASLLYCVCKGDTPPEGVRTSVTGTVARNEKGRLRVAGLHVRIAVSPALEQSARLKRCLGIFEDYCVVTASIRQAIPVTVEVLDSTQRVLHWSN
jgi:uncharacterized OsmC-like protein